MVSTPAIDPALLERVMKVSGKDDHKVAVDLALREFVARREQRQLLDLLGSMDWDLAYDHKAERSRE